MIKQLLYLYLNVASKHLDVSYVTIIIATIINQYLQIHLKDIVRNVR